MARITYLLGLTLLTAAFLSPNVWVQAMAFFVYLVHASTGVGRAAQLGHWLSAISLAGYFAGQAAVGPMGVLAWQGRSDEMMWWVVTGLAGTTVHLACAAIAWVKGVRIARGCPDRGEIEEFLTFSWLDTVEA